MSLFKMFVCLVGLTGAGITMQAQEPNPQKQDIEVIINTLDRALGAEFACMSKKVAKSTSFKTKFAYVVKHELTQAQADWLINYVRNLNTLTAITLDDLMFIAETLSTYERREAMNRATATYCPELMQRIELTRCQDVSDEERIALTKELEQVDLHDAGFNAVKKFMCQCAYVEGIQASKKSKLYTCIKRINRAIAFPFVLFNDFYFFALGWEKQLKKSAIRFAIIHTVTSHMLEALK